MIKKLNFLIYFLGFLFFVPLHAQNKIAEAKKFQKELNISFATPASSPLSDKAREKFTTLDFFPIDTSFYVIADFVRTPFETPFAMPTTTERKPVYIKYGEVYFELKGEEFKLNVYQSRELSANPEFKDYLFLPFTDLTNGETTYSGGRYVDMKIPKSNKVVIDFNQAYNPYCAYNGGYSCPIPPPENHLEIKIEAGVKKYEH